MWMFDAVGDSKTRGTWIICRLAYGNVIVTLTKATDNPRLNEVLLKALKRWRFFLAIQNGIAISSIVELRIPISVE